MRDDALKKVEQVLEMIEDAGIKLEHRNLAQERQDEILDKEVHYIQT